MKLFLVAAIVGALAWSPFVVGEVIIGEKIELGDDRRARLVSALSSLDTLGKIAQLEVFETRHDGGEKYGARIAFQDQDTASGYRRYTASCSSIDLHDWTCDPVRVGSVLSLGRPRMEVSVNNFESSSDALLILQNVYENLGALNDSECEFRGVFLSMLSLSKIRPGRYLISGPYSWIEFTGRGRDDYQIQDCGQNIE